MSDIKVSIIIPIYNVESYIADCLQSVMNQTMTEGVECILVDDCGQDNSMHIAEQMIAEYKGAIQFSILHHEHNKGLSGARNTGIRAAKGEYLYFLDSDDEITPDCIAALSEPLNDCDYDMVIGDYKVEGSELKFPKLYMTTGETYIGNQIPWSYAHRKWMQTAWNKLYNTDYLRRENLQFKEGLIHEDELWSLEIAATAKRICGVKTDTYIYKVRSNSIMTGKSNERNERRFKALMTIHEEYLNFAVSRNILKNPDYFMLYYHCYSLCLRIAAQMSEEKEKYMVKEFHELSRINIFDIFRLNKFNIKSYILNTHIVLPGVLGWWWYSLVFKPIMKVNSKVKS